MSNGGDSLADTQNEMYLELRKKGLSKQDAALLANPPSMTEKRANS